MNMRTICFTIMLLLAVASLSLAANNVSTIRLTFSNAGISLPDTFGIGIGYSCCMDTCRKLPVLEYELPPLPPIGVIDARFKESDCFGEGMKIDYQPGSYFTDVADTFIYSIQPANDGLPWQLAWDTTRIGNKLSSLELRDAVTRGAVVNRDMLLTDTANFIPGTVPANVMQFLIVAHWKAIDPSSCDYCSYSLLSMSNDRLNFGRMHSGEFKDMPFTIRNLGTGNLTISGFTTTPDAYAISGDTRVIGKHDSAHYTIRFNPTAGGTYSGALIIASDSPTSPDTVNLYGSQLVGVAEENGLPRAFALHQNFPNPFNPGTIIQYDLPSREFVRIGVYNILGQEVATPVNAMQEAGYRTVSLQLPNLPSGIYLYRLNAGTFTSTKRMLLIR